MNNFFTLYGYELKKILKNKFTIAMLIMLTLIIAAVSVFPIMDSTDKQIKAAQMTLNGRAIDDTLLNEMYDVMIDEYGVKWNLDNCAYEEIASIERGIMGYSYSLIGITADDMYNSRKEFNTEVLYMHGATDSEIEWIERQDEKVEKPFIYEYHVGPTKITDTMFLPATLGFLLAAIVLSSVLTGEHSRRTDQLILSSRYGRRKTYFAKMLAGISIMLLTIILWIAIMFIGVGCTIGFNGMNAAIQIDIVYSWYPFTIGQIITRWCVMLVLAAVLYAVAAMFISELLKSRLGAIGIMTVLYFLGNFFPSNANTRPVAHIIQLLPTVQLDNDSFWSSWLFKIGGKYFMDMQIAPVLYALLSIIMVLLGVRLYCRYQVSGR